MRCFFAFLLVLGGASVSAADDKPKLAKVTGAIELAGEAMPFGPDTVVTVQIQDVSIADKAATVLGKVEIKDAKKFPIAFTVEYDPAKVNLRARIGLSVRITTGGKLAYINDTFIGVISGGNPNEGVKAKVIAIKR
jgi:uncharacterized lipoprotein YbaY